MESPLSGVTARCAAWVLDSPRWKFLTILFVVMFFKTGMVFVAPHTLEIAQDPYTNPFVHPLDEYQFWSWLGPFLAHQVGATTAFTFSLFYFVFAVLFTVLMVRWMFTRLDEQLARTATLVFALFPVSAVPYYWLFTDSLTLFLIACALYFPRQRLVVMAIGAALGMQHFEQGFFGAGAAFFALAWTARRGVRLDYDWRWALSLLIGTVMGKALLFVIFAHYHVDVYGGRGAWLMKRWVHMLVKFGYSIHFMVFSVFGVGWLVVIQFLRRKTPDALPVGLAIGGLLFLLPISEDPTRVLAIVTFPLVCVFVLRNAGFLATLRRETVGLLALLWFVVPWMYVWRGEPQAPAPVYDIWYGIHHLLDTPKAPKDPRFFF